MIYVCLAIQTHTVDELETEAGRVDVGGLLEKVSLKAKNWLVSSSQGVEYGISPASGLDEEIYLILFCAS